MSTKETQEAEELESFNSTLTVVSPPPETMTPTHHSLEPPFNPTLTVSPVPGLEVGAEVGALVGAEVGAVVGAEVGLVVGAVEGAPVGAEVGLVVGAVVGALVGANVGFGVVVGAGVVGLVPERVARRGPVKN